MNTSDIYNILHSTSYRDNDSQGFEDNREKQGMKTTTNIETRNAY